MPTTRTGKRSAVTPPSLSSSSKTKRVRGTGESAKSSTATRSSARASTPEGSRAQSAKQGRPTVRRRKTSETLEQVENNSAEFEGAGESQRSRKRQNLQAKKSTLKDDSEDDGDKVILENFDQESEAKSETGVSSDSDDDAPEEVTISAAKENILQDIREAKRSASELKASQKQMRRAKEERRRQLAEESRVPALAGVPEFPSDVFEDDDPSEGSDNGIGHKLGDIRFDSEAQKTHLKFLSGDSEDEDQDDDQDEGQMLKFAKEARINRIGNIQVRVLQDVVQEAADMEAIQNMRKQRANSIAKQKAASNFKRSKMRGPCKAFV